MLAMLASSLSTSGYEARSGAKVALLFELVAGVRAKPMPGPNQFTTNGNDPLVVTPLGQTNSPPIGSFQAVCANSPCSADSPDHMQAFNPRQVGQSGLTH
jgi:hypothetical protein